MSRSVRLVVLAVELIDDENEQQRNNEKSQLPPVSAALAS